MLQNSSCDRVEIINFMLSLPNYNVSFFLIYAFSEDKLIFIFSVKWSPFMTKDDLPVKSSFFMLHSMPLYGGIIFYLPYPILVFCFIHNIVTVILIYISLHSCPVTFTNNSTILHFQRKCAGFRTYIYKTRFYQFCQSFSFCWYSIQNIISGLF